MYCSRNFAAMVETLFVRRFECGLVGRADLAKGYGTGTVFNVRWSDGVVG